MYMRVFKARIEPGEEEQYHQRWKELMSPYLAQEQGLQHLYSTQGKNSETVVVSIWDSKEAADAWGSSALYDETGLELDKFFTAPPEIEGYEVKNHY